MTVLGTSEISSNLTDELPESALSEDSERATVPATTSASESAEFEAEATHEEFPPESSENLVELRPQEGKDLVDELSFAENPVALVEPDGLSAMGEAASARGYLWILLRRPGPQHRGRLGLYIEETIEQQLEDRGALPPGIHASTGLDASLSDQLYRARLVEMRGIALGIPSLEGITNLGRALDAEDSAVLRWWMASTSDRPVRMVLSNENTRLRVYPSPVLFQSLFEVAPGHVTPIPASLSMAASAESMELSDLPPSVEENHAETNVFGTEVAGVDALEDGDAEDTPCAADRAWFDQDDDVELPDLDVALGLSPAPSVSSIAEQAPVVPRVNGTKARQAGRQQLEFEGLDVSPSAPAVEATESLVSSQEHSAEMSFNGEAVPVDEEPAQPILEDELAADAPEGADAMFDSTPPEESLRSVEDAHSSEALKAKDEAPMASLLESETPELESEGHESLERAWSDDGETDIDDIDTEEFLKTLEEDSARAPSVTTEAASAERDAEEKALAAIEAAPLAESEPAAESPLPEPTPLPTKSIARNPFIRLADPKEAVCDSVDGELASEPLEESREAAPAPATVEVARETPADEALEPSASDVSAQSSEAAHDGSSLTTEPVKEADPNDPFNQLAAREWKQWVRNLEAARGPKPLSVIERMFVTDYTRLREAVRRGVAAPTANDILDEWQESFTSSYSEAFDALRVRGKRPTMVLDLPELASRLGRLQGARRVQLLMVDGLRFDLGLMIQERMRSAADASLTERLLLWSALPSVTSYQLELLGKGPDGLKEPGDIDEPPALVARGAAARSPRRVRTGSLELLKLDVVADALRQPGAPVVERMESIADDASAAIVDHLNKQPARTMVIVFGDHGFALDPAAIGTTEEVKQGGASPEEVLVPAFAWLTGATH